MHHISVVDLEATVDPLLVDGRAAEESGEECREVAELVARGQSRRWLAVGAALLSAGLVTFIAARKIGHLSGLTIDDAEQAWAEKPWNSRGLILASPGLLLSTAAERSDNRSNSSLSTCSSSGEECSESKCCSTPGEFCFMKNQFWGRCGADCRPGIHDEDPKEYRSPWSCELAVEDGQPLYPDLFCFMGLQSDGLELQLGKKQAEMRGGIFSCDYHVVFSDKEFQLAPGVVTKKLDHFKARLSVKGALTATWVNTEGFIEAWDTLGKMLDPWLADWMVKVDPDTVFFPVRLKSMLRDLEMEYSETLETSGMYIQNCMVEGNLQFYGSTELISNKALMHLSERNNSCLDLPLDMMGEDMWMQRCMEEIHIVGTPLPNLLHDRYCPVAKDKWCDVDGAAFHPYKTPEQWYKCYNWALGDAPDKSDK